MSNIAFNEKTFENISTGLAGDTMSVEGSVKKSFLLIAITILSAVGVWMYQPLAEIVVPYFWVLAILGFILALIIIFKPKTAPALAPVYAIAEGGFLAAISLFYASMYDGIIVQAVGLTFAIFLIMLGLYTSRIIKVTQKFRMWVVACTWAIMLMYIVAIIGSLTGLYDLAFIHSSGPLWIGVSVFIVWIAAFNLALDFDTIESWVANRAPKYYEWFAAFGLLVTLVWLYLEVLRLLAKIRWND